MPIFEYRCDSCGKKMEALQKDRNTLKTCDQVLNCEGKGEIHRLISSFSFKGDTSSADRFMDNRAPSTTHTHSSGCGCFGTSSCPSSEIRNKYGLD